MTKGLEALKIMIGNGYVNPTCKELIPIEKELKALEIIKEKRVNVDWLLETENAEEYNESLYNDLTQKEYELLKEVLL